MGALMPSKYMLKVVQDNVQSILVPATLLHHEPNIMTLLGLIGDLLQAINELSERIEQLEDKANV